MKIKDGFIMRELADQTVVVATGEASRSFNGIIKLNSTGRFLWKLLESETTEIDLVAAIRDAYDVDAETAQRDVARFVQSLRDEDLLQ